MSAAGWEALAVRAYYWANPGLGDPDGCAEARERAEYEYYHAKTYCCDRESEFAGLALFARLMAVTMKPEICGGCHTDKITIDSPGLIHICGRTRGPFDDINKVPASKLQAALRGYHAGEDNGELMALLVEAWGERAVESCGDLFYYDGGSVRCELPLDHDETEHAGGGVHWRDV